MKLSLKNVTLIALLAGVSVGGVAVAKHHAGGKGHHGERAERMFERMDADKDGKVTAEEAVAAAKARFGKRDTDGDGVISREERKAFRKARREDRRAKRFEMIDADGDGSISLEEFKEARLGRRGMRGERGHHGHRMRRGGGMRGVLTIEEAEARAMHRFERIDADGDGVITVEDVKAMKPRRGRH